jgi:hypothetical protein
MIFKLISWFIGLFLSSIIIYIFFFISLYTAKCIKKIKIWRNKKDMQYKNTEDLKRIFEREIWKN